MDLSHLQGRALPIATDKRIHRRAHYAIALAVTMTLSAIPLNTLFAQADVARSLSGRVGVRSSDEPPTVPFCELIRSASPYNNRLVRTSVTALTNHFEVAYLYSPACNKKKSYAHFRVANDHVRQALDHVMAPHQRGEVTTADVTVVGRFSTGNRYGHLNTFRHEFMIEKVEQILDSDLRSTNAAHSADQFLKLKGISQKRAISIAKNEARRLHQDIHGFRIVPCEEVGFWRIMFDGGGPEFVIGKETGTVVRVQKVPQSSPHSSQISGPAITKEQAINIAKRDVPQSYAVYRMNPEYFAVIACEQNKAWRVIFDFKLDRLPSSKYELLPNAKFPKYVIDKASGGIIYRELN